LRGPLPAQYFILVALLCGCAKAEAHECGEATVEKPPAHDQIKLTKAKWSELPGWADDQHHEAVPAFIVSCVKLAELKDDDFVGADVHGGNPKQWRRACDKASKLKQGDNKAAREFFESEFTPWQAASNASPVGKLTGYFVQELHASRNDSLDTGVAQATLRSTPPRTSSTETMIGDAARADNRRV
jgi:membrane-bound lytic murein transglycosylase A